MQKHVPPKNRAITLYDFASSRIFGEMIEDLRQMIAKRPFVPFTIHTVDGGAMRVPTLDHVHITPNGNRVFVFFDDGRWDDIRPLMISRVTIDQRNGET